MNDLAALEVLAEPRRRAILEVLRDGERPVGALVGALGLSQPAVSKHLRVLREAGVVRVHADGQRRLYELAPEPLMELAAWLEPYRQMWRESLDKLERHLDEPAPPRPDQPTTTTTTTRKRR
jgi:DNA-binding transcriptional ArsR family regulator